MSMPIGSPFHARPAASSEADVVDALLGCHRRLPFDPEREWARASSPSIIDSLGDAVSAVRVRARDAIEDLVELFGSTSGTGPGWPIFEEPWLALSDLEDEAKESDGADDDASDRAA